MTAPLPPRRPGDPLARTPDPLLPPAARSREALALAVHAGRGRFALQVCAACGAVQYPPREACHECLAADLPWRDVPPGGTVLAVTTTRISADPYFRRRTPWRSGLVALDCGPAVVAHLHGDVAAGDRTRLALRLDKSGQAVMLAMPAQDTPHMHDDLQLREMTADPKGRRILVTDGRAAVGQEVARALLAAGAAQVFLGIADAWKPFPGQAALPGDPIALDLTDAASVREAAAEFGGRIDIVVNTSLHIRPGDVLARGDTVRAREEMELAFFGPMRLAQALGPALRARAADGPYAPCAWADILSIAALAPLPGYAANAAAQAAALSLSHSLRRELRPLRVLTAFVGPIDDAWHEALPPPKLAPAALAAGLVRALREGLEEVVLGDIAQDVMNRWTDNPSLLARELAAG